MPANGDSLSRVRSKAVMNLMLMGAAEPSRGRPPLEAPDANLGDYKSHE